MPKKYQDRNMGTEFATREGQYFYPKAPGGPIVIIASGQEEADSLYAKQFNK